MAKKKSINFKKLFKKNKYNLILLVIGLIIVFFLASTIFNFAKNAGVSKYDKEIIVIKNKGDELKSYTLKDIRKMKTETIELTLKNQESKTKVEGVSLEKIINELNTDFSLSSSIDFVSPSGERKTLSMDKVLEPERVYLIYKINSKPLIEYDKKYGYFTIIDSQSKDTKDWILNVNSFNIR